MTNIKRIGVTLEVTSTRSSFYDLNVDELKEWGGDENDPESIYEFIKAGRDYDDVLEEMDRHSLFVRQDWSELDKVIL